MELCLFDALWLTQGHSSDFLFVSTAVFSGSIPDPLHWQEDQVCRFPSVTSGLYMKYTAYLWVTFSLKTQR